MEGIAMSVDALQEKIRKTKNPSVLYFDGVTDWIPPHIRAAAKMKQLPMAHFAAACWVN